MGKRLTLFGGDQGWDCDEWTASDDRVRGGKSQSYLECSSSSGRFHGELDIETLGGAGFASQRTTGDDRTWDLSEYDGIELKISKADEKQYTFILKDKLLPKNLEDGREQSTISYEYDFHLASEEAMGDGATIFISWNSFTPTYRGRKQDDAPKLSTDSVKRFSIMMRSFFGDQHGPFSMTVTSISAIEKPQDEDEKRDLGRLEKGIPIVLNWRKTLNKKKPVPLPESRSHSWLKLTFGAGIIIVFLFLGPFAWKPHW